LKSAIVNYTGEIILVPIQDGLTTKFNKEIGIEVWDL